MAERKKAPPPYDGEELNLCIAEEFDFSNTSALDELMSQRWLWLMVPNNCAAFLEQIVQAGGSDAGLRLNCPTLEQLR